MYMQFSLSTEYFVLWPLWKEAFRSHAPSGLIVFMLAKIVNKECAYKDG
ncbi:hypothetical protein FHT67_002170 [Paenibacillus sp. BK720]|nr:hypothetical protein [Paenibacillus sp. BK720]